MRRPRRDVVLQHLQALASVGVTRVAVGLLTEPGTGYRLYAD